MKGYNHRAKLESLWFFDACSPICVRSKIRKSGTSSEKLGVWGKSTVRNLGTEILGFLPG